MFPRNSRHRTVSLVLAVVLIGGVGSLAGCRTVTGASGPDSRVVTIRYERSEAATPSYEGLPADRVEDAIAREAAHDAALSARFAGMPADRIEEQLERETAQ